MSRCLENYSLQNRKRDFYSFASFFIYIYLKYFDSRKWSFLSLTRQLFFAYGNFFTELPFLETISFQIKYTAVSIKERLEKEIDLLPWKIIFISPIFFKNLFNFKDPSKIRVCENLDIFYLTCKIAKVDKSKLTVIQVQL